MTADHRYSVSVAGVVIDDDGRALIIQRRDNGHWEPPGGILEHGESIEEGLRREVFEETGVTVVPDQLSGIYQNMERNIVALVFRCRALSGRPAESDEASCFKWATPAELQELMTEAYGVRVLDALTPGQLRVRAHNGVHLIR
jgi:8-oxo-dGTP diphosphatase